VDPDPRQCQDDSSLAALPDIHLFPARHTTPSALNFTFRPFPIRLELRAASRHLNAPDLVEGNSTAVTGRHGAPEDEFKWRAPRRNPGVGLEVLAGKPHCCLKLSVQGGL
jgi:hypothetical protein